MNKVLFPLGLLFGFVGVLFLTTFNDMVLPNHDFEKDYITSGVIKTAVVTKPYKNRRSTTFYMELERDSTLYKLPRFNLTNYPEVSEALNQLKPGQSVRISYDLEGKELFDELKKKSATPDAQFSPNLNMVVVSREEVFSIQTLIDKENVWNWAKLIFKWFLGIVLSCVSILLFWIGVKTDNTISNLDLPQ